jgi:predicted outer membrane repeat protein
MSRNYQKYFYLAIVAILCFTMLGSPGKTHAAATINVNTGLDTINDPRYCSLRAAIIAANENRKVAGCAAGTPGMDYIYLPADFYLLSIKGSGENAGYTGDLDITETLTIVGGGPQLTIIQAQYGSVSFQDRIFHVNTKKAPVYISNLQIKEGNAVAGHGGGIYNENSNLYIKNVMFNYNKADLGGGGVSNSAGSFLSIENSVFLSNNSWQAGGGLFNAGKADITNVLFEKNTASSSGGGIDNNAALADVVKLTNVTVTGNTATNGAGIWNDGTIQIQNSTIVSNNNGAGIGMAGAGWIRNSIVARHGDGNCWIDSAVAKFVSQGTNMTDVAGCWFDTGKGDIVALDLGLAWGLANNGGFSRTFALLEGSPAIDAGNNAGCPPTDQRWLAPRPINGVCDIGAFEYGFVASQLYIPNISR